MAAWRYEISLLVLKKMSRVSAANEWNIFQHSKKKVRISTQPCNILYFSINYKKIIINISININIILLLLLSFYMNDLKMTFTRDCHFNFIFRQQILMIRKLALVSPRMSKSSLFNLQFCFPHSVIVRRWCYANIIHKPIDFGPLQIVTNCSIMCLACVDDFWSLGYTLAHIRNNGKIWDTCDKSQTKHSISYIHNKHCPYNDFAKVIF